MNEEANLNNRIEWVDTLKGIGILLVVVGHTAVPDSLKQYFFSFHMPLFFFISGYLFYFSEFSKTGSFDTYVKNKLKHLIKPYFLFGLFSYLVWIFDNTLTFKFGLNHTPYNLKTQLIDPMIGLAYSDENRLELNVALWFLTCLFLTELLFFLFHRITHGKIKFLVPLLLFSAVAGFILSTFKILLPWNLTTAFTAVVFYGAGYLVSRYHILICTKINNIPAILILLAAGLTAHLFNGKINMAYALYSNIFLFYISSLSTVIAVDLIVRKIKPNKFLCLIGKSSMDIMGLHLVIFMLFNDALKLSNKVIFKQKIDLTADHIVLPVFYTVLSVLLILLYTSKIKPKILKMRA